MNLIDEKNSWYNLSFTLLSPLSYSFINLLSNLLCNLSCCSWKQSQKSLRSWINNIDFMKCDCMNNFFAFLNLTLRTVNESCLRAHSIIIRCSCKTTTSFRNFAGCFINCYNISRDYFFFLYCLYHFLSKIINCFHFSCL